MAEGFLAFVESEYCSEESIDNLSRVIASVLQNIKQQHSSHITQKMYTEHSKQQQDDIQEADAMLSILLSESSPWAEKKS